MMRIGGEFKEINCKQSMTDQRARAHVIAWSFEGAACQRRLEIIEIDALERFFDVKLARFAGRIDSIPIEHTISCVGVLLDFENNQSFSQRVDAAAREKKRIAFAHG